MICACIARNHYGSPECKNQATEANGLCSTCDVCYAINGACRPPDPPAKPLEATNDDADVRIPTKELLDRLAEDKFGV